LNSRRRSEAGPLGIREITTRHPRQLPGPAARHRRILKPMIRTWNKP
jgi:hypothetical protein